MDIIKIEIFAIVALLFASCSGGGNTQGSDEGIRQFDLTGNHAKKIVSLNEMGSNLRIIRLETIDESLLNYFTGHIGDKFIVALENDRILQFDSEGNFLRTIAVKGKGPGEFTQVDAWVVDDTEDYLTYHDLAKNYFYRYNLNTGQGEDHLSFQENGYLGGMVLAPCIASRAVALTLVHGEALPAAKASSSPSCLFLFWIA